MKSSMLKVLVLEAVRLLVVVVIIFIVASIIGRCDISAITSNWSCSSAFSCRVSQKAQEELARGNKRRRGYQAGEFHLGTGDCVAIAQIDDLNFWKCWPLRHAEALRLALKHPTEVRGNVPAAHFGRLFEGASSDGPALVVFYRPGSMAFRQTVLHRFVGPSASGTSQ